MSIGFRLCLAAGLAMTAAACGASDPGGSAGTGDAWSYDDAVPDIGTQPPGTCLPGVWAGVEDFDYRCTRDVAVDAAVVHRDGSPWAGVVVRVFAESVEAPELRGALVATGRTGADGRFVATVRMPGARGSVRVVGSFLGAVSDVQVPIVDGAASVVLGREEQP